MGSDGAAVSVVDEDGAAGTSVWAETRGEAMAQAKSKEAWAKQEGSRWETDLSTSRGKAAIKRDSGISSPRKGTRTHKKNGPAFCGSSRLFVARKVPRGSRGFWPAMVQEAAEGTEAALPDMRLRKFMVDKGQRYADGSLLPQKGAKSHETFPSHLPPRETT